MVRLLFCISYNGSAYHGWQVQQNAITVQEVVQDSIEKVVGSRTDIVACSRTDAKVHANKFYFHMDIDVNIPKENLRRAISTFLPFDIEVISIVEVSPSFHARYSAKSKEYLYKIHNSKIRNPFLKDLAWHYDRKLNIDKIKLAAKEFIGEHDFTSFCSSKSSVVKKTRNIYNIELSQDREMVIFKFIGNGFLHNMVRILVGTLIGVSEGLIDIDDIKNIIIAKDRSLAGKTAPAKGLYLNDVKY